MASYALTVVDRFGRTVVVQYFEQDAWGKVMTAWLSSSVAPLGIIRWMRLPGTR